MFIIYSKDDCPWCIKAKTLLENLGYQYQEKVLGKDYLKEELVALLDRTKVTVPQIYHDSEHIGGFEDLVKYFGLK